MDGLVAALDAERIYSTVDELAQAMYTTRAGPAGFLPWVRHIPESCRSSRVCRGSFSTPLRRVTILLDTGTSHCLICARLAAALGLPLSGQPGRFQLITW